MQSRTFYLYVQRKDETWQEICAIRNPLADRDIYYIPKEQEKQEEHK